MIVHIYNDSSLNLNLIHPLQYPIRASNIDSFPHFIFHIHRQYNFE